MSEHPTRDDELVPHAFKSRTPYEPGDNRDIWCQDCEYHRDHQIHSCRVSPTFSKCGHCLAADTIESLSARLAQAEQERDKFENRHFAAELRAAGCEASSLTRLAKAVLSHEHLAGMWSGGTDEADPSGENEDREHQRAVEALTKYTARIKDYVRRDLAVRLLQAHQERDEAVARIPTEQPERGGRFVLNAYGRACYHQGLAQGRADTLAQVKALIEKTIIAPSEHAVWRSLKVHIQHQLEALPVSPPQEITEKERA